MGILSSARSAPVDRSAEVATGLERRALAELVQIWARDGFSVVGQAQAELEHWAESWRPVIIAGRGQPPSDAPDSSDPDPTYASRPELAALLRSAAHRRSVEQRFVRSTLPALAANFMNVVMETKDALLEDVRDDEEIARAVALLEEAAQGADPVALKTRADQVSRVVRRKADARRRRSETRMRALGQRLAEQREALVDPETQGATDAVTGLRSRHALEAIVERERLISQLARMPTSIAKLSIGSGPSAPSRDMVDQIMELVAQRVGPLVRAHFFLGRFSGDQLMIVMPELDELEAAEQATAYVKAVLGRPLEISGRAFKTPFSAGVAECLPEERRDEWILRADEALEVAQSSQAGRRAIRYSEL